jgi:Ribosomal protein HS6-type (S12/L30/L7a)
MQDKLLAMLGLARRAGRLYAGFDLAVEKIRENQAVLAIAAADISDKTFKNLLFESERKGIKAIRLSVNMEELGKACGVRAGIAIITDSGFAEAVMRLYEGHDKKKEEHANDD